ncbi:hypothetical protein CPB84DRAFT_1848883 [Gymnopilus junonius]|uniref:Uncharacterized protein n=1 Tax=Gymnopilus junonius TaxID=109634 RepID=A0A9P5TKA3_GYMJU|nr:hypothetical protein CPB84DRAFT_1848883 [Gymnopilus junonius]
MGGLVNGPHSFVFSTQDENQEELGSWSICAYGEGEGEGQCRYNYQSQNDYQSDPDHFQLPTPGSHQPKKEEVLPASVGFFLLILPTSSASTSTATLAGPLTIPPVPPFFHFVLLRFFIGHPLRPLRPPPPPPPLSQTPSTITVTAIMIEVAVQGEQKMQQRKLNSHVYCSSCFIALTELFNHAIDIKISSTLYPLWSSFLTLGSSQCPSYLEFAVVVDA